MVVAQVNREELAWAAGFFDGEGCTTSQLKPGRSWPKIHIAQSSQPDEGVSEVRLRLKEADD